MQPSKWNDTIEGIIRAIPQYSVDSDYQIDRTTAFNTILEASRNKAKWTDQIFVMDAELIAFRPVKSEVHQ